MSKGRDSFVCLTNECQHCQGQNFRKIPNVNGIIEQDILQKQSQRFNGSIPRFAFLLLLNGHNLYYFILEENMSSGNLFRLFHKRPVLLFHGTH